MQTLGGALAGEPYLGSAVICGGLLQRCGAERRLAALIEGQLRPAWAGHELAARHDPLAVQSTLRSHGEGWRLNGRKSLVLAAPGATHFIVSAMHGRDIALAWVPADAPGIGRRDYRTVDGSWAVRTGLRRRARCRPTRCWASPAPRRSRRCSARWTRPRWRCVPRRWA